MSWNKRRALLAAALAGAWVMNTGAAGTPQGQAGAAPGDPLLPHIAILQADKAPAVDGKLDDPCWAKAEEGRIETDEYSFPLPVKTTFKICQNGDVLYLAIRCPYGEKGGKRAGGPVQHDGALWNGENVEIFIDPDNADTPGYYQFILTTFDDTGDFYNNEPRDPEIRWEPKYEAKSQWSSNEWTIEYGVPLSAFTFTKTIYENFGLNIHRVGPGVSAWSPGHSEGFHFPHKFGEARGLKGAGVASNAPGLFRSPYMKVNDRVIKAKANPSLIPEKPPALVSGPEVKASESSAEIGFEVNTKTDVAVWIEDAKGERVRHLAAGMLGSSAPAPLKKDSLKQSVAWDYLDDFGKPVPAGAYKVKVGVGSQAKLDKEFGRYDGPSQINGLAVDAKGFMYTIGGHLDQWSQVMKFDRAGKFVSMLMPPPADVPVEKLKGLNIIDFGPDGRATFGGNRLATTMPHLDQPMPHTLLVNSKGQVIFYGGEYQGGPTHLYKINADGSLPEDFLGPYIKDFSWLVFYEDYAKRFHFALDPLDEDMIYISGLKENHRGDAQALELTPGSRDTFYNAVYRIRWGKDAPLEVFAGKPNTHGTAGSDKPGEFYDPQGIAFDKDNNLWVCDRRNNRIQILDRKGKCLRQIPCANPYQVCISRKTGESYVMSGVFGQGGFSATTKDPVSLAKYSAGAAPRALAQTNLPAAWNYWWTMALDESGSKPELAIAWTGPDGPNASGAARHVMRIADLGDRFSEPNMIIGQNHVDGYYRVAAGWDSDIVCAGNSWFDGNTGRLLAKHSPGTELAAARDGRWVSLEGFFPEYLTVQPAAWATNAGLPALATWPLDPPALARNGRRGIAVAPNSDIYVARYYNWSYQASVRGGEEGPDHHIAVDRYSMDGKLTGRRVVYELSGGAHSPAVDIKGNIYVCDNFGRRIGQFYEDDIAANMPAWAPDYHISEADWETLRSGKTLYAGYRKFVQNPLIKSVGSLFKFGPKGGGLLWRAGQGEYKVYFPQTNANGQVVYPDWHYPAAPAPKRPATHWSSTWRATVDGHEGMYPAWLDGVEWEFLGVSHSSGRYSKGHDACICFSMRICVDDFGRTYAPAAHRSTVRMIDTAGNEVLRIGSYGNLDSGPGGRLKTPDIPLRYPTAAALSKRYLYVVEADIARILQIKMGYQQEAGADVVVK